MIKKIIIVTIVTLLLASGGYLFIRRNTKLTFTLIKESDPVFFSNSDTNYQQMLEDELTLQSGYFIKTEGGSAHIIYPDNSMTSIDSNTQLQVFVKTSGIDIKQTLGNTWHRVQKVIGTKSYSVETPTAIASVRGTKFAVEVNDSGSKNANIMVKEGSVRLDQIDPADFRKLVKKSRATKLLGAGKIAYITDVPNTMAAPRPDGSSEKGAEATHGINIGDISTNKTDSIFFIRNAIIDNEYDRKPNKTFIKDFRKGILNQIRDVKDIQELREIREIQESTPGLDISTIRNRIIERNSLYRAPVVDTPETLQLVTPYLKPTTSTLNFTNSPRRVAPSITTTPTTPTPKPTPKPNITPVRSVTPTVQLQLRPLLLKPIIIATPTPAQDLSKFDYYINIDKYGTQICSNYQRQTPANVISQIDAINFTQEDILIKLVKNIENACIDDKINSQELTTLKSIYASIKR